MHEIDDGDRITLIYQVAERLAADVRKLMREHNDFSLPEAIIDQMAVELGVPVVVGDVDHAKNVRLLGNAFVRAVDWGSRSEDGRPDVIEIVGDVLRDVRAQLALQGSDSARPGTIRRTRPTTARPPPRLAGHERMRRPEPPSLVGV